MAKDIPIITAADKRERAKEQRKSRQQKLVRLGRKKSQRSVVQVVTCKNETELIAGYLESNLSPRVAAAFEAHIGRCSDCAAFLRTYRKTIEAARVFLNLQTDHNPLKKLPFGQ